jgi:hypothetical protein
MTLPRTVADVLARRVSFEIEAIDRMYCNVYDSVAQFPARRLWSVTWPYCPERITGSVAAGASVSGEVGG